MATHNSTTPGLSSETQSSGEFDGEDFSNNLFTDLAPLLTLFGEQVTKQFLSGSMGFGDDILLAMAPLGILTCVVSAIRVGGRRWLKALVGRAREIRATAELELLSCTSDAVCELWSGTEIVRERGTPQTKEFIYRTNNFSHFPEISATNLVFDLKTACLHRIMSVERLLRASRTTARTPTVDLSTELATRAMTQAPNLTLSVSNATTPPLATWFFATVGMTVQVSVIVVAGLVTYHWQIPPQGSTIVGYGFPLFVTGTVVLCAGIFLCSYIVETHTRETNFKPLHDTLDLRIIRIQRACTVGDQRYGSYAIMNGEENNTLRTSRINEPPNHSWLSLTAAIMSIGGYILQFIGLRAMHWSVAVAVLSATLIMAVARAYVRHGLAANPSVMKLLEGHELSWLVMDAYQFESFRIVQGPPLVDTTDWVNNKEGSHNAILLTESKIRAIVNERKAVEGLVSWEDEYSGIARQLATAITGILEFASAKDSGIDLVELSQVLAHKSHINTEPAHGSGQRKARNPTAYGSYTTSDQSGSNESPHGSGQRMARQSIAYGFYTTSDQSDPETISGTESESSSSPATDSSPSTNKQGHFLPWFEWKCPVGFKRHKSMPEEAGYYRLFANGVHLKHTHERIRATAPGSRETQRDGWSMDIPYLAAAISFAFTVTKLSVPGQSRVRLLGRGWGIPVRSSIPSNLEVSEWQENIGTGSRRAKQAFHFGKQARLPKETTEPRGKAENASPGGSDPRNTRRNKAGLHYEMENWHNAWLSPWLDDICPVGASGMFSRSEYMHRLFGTSVDRVSRELREKATVQENRLVKDTPTRHDDPAQVTTTHPFRKIYQQRHISRVLFYIDPSGELSQDTNWLEGLENPTGIYIRHSPKRLCAHEIFTEFMLQLASEMLDIGGQTLRHLDPFPKWSNTVVSKLAEIVYKSGLAESETDAYMLVVPPLHAYGLLPTSPSPGPQ
ncbi:hypothetical protein BJY04DRAFT_213283 [Aspergillus karnatakaensis]|uniref:uncharacterized protein n=1 Tax=Aspergillus karnatakaensis TaxID=1810916 RepID=UPI003CCD030E